MANIKSFLTLEDNMSKPLNNIFHAAMNNIKSFFKLDDAMETVTRTTYEWTDAVGNYNKSALEMMYSDEELVEQGFKVANTFEEQIKSQKI